MNLQALVEALTENYRGDAVLQHLLDVGGLDTQLVVGAGLVPVPCPRASGEELGVLERSVLAFDFEVTPGEVRVFGGCNFCSAMSRLSSSLHLLQPYAQGCTATGALRRKAHWPTHKRILGP